MSLQIPHKCHLKPKAVKTKSRNVNFTKIGDYLFTCWQSIIIEAHDDLRQIFRAIWCLRGTDLFHQSQNRGVSSSICQNDVSPMGKYILSVMLMLWMAKLCLKVVSSLCQQFDHSNVSHKSYWLPVAGIYNNYNSSKGIRRGTVSK